MQRAYMPYMQKMSLQSVNEQAMSLHTSSSAPDASKIQPRVSVIIPNWNGEKLLPTCLDSLRGQGYRDFEIIVVDNASGDSSLSLLAEEYPWVKVLRMDSNLFFSGV